MHIKKIYLYVFLCCFIFSFSACKNEDDFSEVSKLISSRNTARYKKAEKQAERKQKKPGLKKIQPKETSENKDKKPAVGKKKFSTEIFYEEEIKIIGSASNSTLGVGTAYLNKDGKIVQIKIKRD